MGIFNSVIKSETDSIYKVIKSEMQEKNGNTHVINFYLDVINSKSVVGISIDSSNSLKLNNIIDNMQNDGYSIIDIKMQLEDFKGKARYNYLVIYK